MVDGLLLGVAKVGFYVKIVGRQQLFHGAERVKAGVVVFAVSEGDGEERGKVVVVGGRFVVVNTLHALNGFDLRLERGSLIRRDVCHHDLRCAVGDELLVHNVESLLGLGIVRQIKGKVAFHLDPAAGEEGKNQQDDRKQEDEVALVYDEGGDLFHKGTAVLFGVTHGARRCLLPECERRGFLRAPVRRGWGRAAPEGSARYR